MDNVMSENKVFEKLNSVDVNGHTEKKVTGGTTLTYLSWCWAWAEVKKRYPEASYEIVKQPNGLPYVYDPNTGYMVNTVVTIEGVTHEMWLPVMDGANNAMKAVPYSYTTKKGKQVDVEAATMTDINKALMRCLTKNLAMFGLGLYIYAGEDLPENPVYEYECSQCKKTFTDVNYAEATLAKFGRYICKDCCDKAAAKQKAKKEAEAKAKAEKEEKFEQTVINEIKHEPKGEPFPMPEEHYEDLPFPI